MMENKFQVGQVVFDKLTKRTLLVEKVTVFDSAEIILVKGVRLKKDGTPYARRVHNLLTHSEKFPLVIV